MIIAVYPCTRRRAGRLGVRSHVESTSTAQFLCALDVYQEDVGLS